MAEQYFEIALRQERETYRERSRQLIKAEMKASKLLWSMLTPHQKETFKSDQEIIVRGSKGGTYRIDCTSTAENVYRLDKDGDRVMIYCAGPPGVPASDFWLAQKLLIESDEQAFLRVAIASNY